MGGCGSRLLPAGTLAAKLALVRGFFATSLLLKHQISVSTKKFVIMTFLAFLLYSISSAIFRRVPYLTEDYQLCENFAATPTAGAPVSAAVVGPPPVRGGAGLLSAQHPGGGGQQRGGSGHGPLHSLLLQGSASCRLPSRIFGGITNFQMLLEVMP